MFAGTVKTTPVTNSPEFRYHAVNCVVVTIAIVSVCVMVACGVFIVREYALAKDYAETECTLRNVTFGTMTRCSHCSVKKGQKGKGTCTDSFFPCLQIMVTYWHERRKYHALLHADSLQARGQFKQCSFSVCLKTVEENQAAVEEYSSSWKKTTSAKFQCYFNQHHHASVIQYKKHSKSDVVHSMLWPSLVICVCGVIFLRLEMTRRGLTCCGNEQEGTTYTPHRRQQFKSGSGKLKTHSRNGQTSGGSKVIAMTHQTSGGSEIIAMTHHDDSIKQITHKNNAAETGSSRAIDGLTSRSMTCLDEMKVKRDQQMSIKVPVKAELSKSGDITYALVKSSDCEYDRVSEQNSASKQCRDKLPKHV